MSDSKKLLDTLRAAAAEAQHWPAWRKTEHARTVAAEAFFSATPATEKLGSIAHANGGERVTADK